MISIFGTDGLLREIHHDFEFRPEQLEMAEFINETLSNNSPGIIEAGTGVGKTLAYLVPSILNCIQNGKKLAVTTETRALQKQLVDKDLPIVQNIFKSKGILFKYSLCLGSSNYPCSRRFQYLITRGGFNKQDTVIIDMLSSLITDKKRFSRLDISVPDRIWNEISREPDACANYKCPFFSSCSFQLEKKDWSQSDLLIMNHYLFFTNIASQKTYLPPIDAVIFDEAHSIEDICADQMGFSCSDILVREVMLYLIAPHSQKTLKAHLPVDRHLKAAVKTAQSITIESDRYFETMRNILSEKYSIRMKEITSDASLHLMELFHSYLLILNEISKDIKDENLLLEFDIHRSKVFQINENIKNFSCLSSNDFVYWIERQETDLLGKITIKGQSLDVSDIMYNEVVSFYDSAILTSATLSINGSFNYIKNRLGISECGELLLKSPFNYKKQVVMYLSNSSNEPSHPFYDEQISGEISSIIETVDGNCLILFTSYKSMNGVKSYLSQLTNRNMHIQGDGPASNVLSNYVSDSGSLLLGTHSFWQGIDLAGDLLRGVIITRLPFSVPDRPHIQARTERISERGENPFYNYHIPEAVLKFKQGFGRLIRSGNDRGIVAILDPRITTKSYGQLFLKSIPECTIVRSISDLKTTYEAL